MNQPDVQAEKLRIIGQMASSIAHELSNPLATIVASIQGILAFQQSTLASDQSGAGGQLRSDLDLVLAEARRAGEIVSGLLTFVREPVGNGQQVSLQEALDRVRAIAQNHLKIYDISLHSPDRAEAKEYSKIYLQRGSGQLQQILLNLIINAQQTMTARRTSGNIFVTLWMEDAATAAIAIADDGPGVLPEIRHRIFEPFFTTKPDNGGTGLGLAICRDLASQLGGSIDLTESAYGGACFTVNIPVVRKTDHNDHPASPQEPESPRQPTFECGHRILLVDDEPGIVRSVGRYLTSLGYSVTTATSGEDAIASLRRTSFDAVVSDLRMPALSGEDLYALVQAEFPALARRVVFASGDMMREETQQFLSQAGCLALQKPYELSELTDALEKLCTNTRNDASERVS